MITDLRGQTSGFIENADLCIVGGGAAGIAIATAFAGAGRKVCLTEAGGLGYEANSQALYAGSSVGRPVALEGGRVRSWGGSMNHWGGRCAELSEAEMVRRPWIRDSGWPLTLAELRPYYRRAWRICGFDTDWALDDVLHTLRMPRLDDLTAAATTQIWRFAPRYGGLYLNFGKVYYDDIRRAANVNAVLHANLTRFETDTRATHITGITVRSLTGVTGTVSARYYVLCCGGIENARLLLAGSERAPEGLGNSRGLVGRYFMEHPRAVAATLFPSDRRSPVQDVLNEFTGADGVRYQVGVALSERAQREHQLLNCSAVFDYVGDPDSGTTAARDIWRNLRDGRWPGDVGGDAWRVLRDLRAVKANLERELQGRPALLPVQSADVIVDIEQVPDPESRVSLGTERDALGMPEAVVDWRLSDLERRTVYEFMFELGVDFARRGIGRLRLEPWVEATDATWKNAISETYHHMGTTRMSLEPETGVVNADCAVHGMDNLYVAGSSVFPTGGHVNPTVTIVALALRLADHLRERLAR